MKLLIRNLSRDTTEVALKALFEAYGTVQSCDLVLDKTTGNSKGFAFVAMPKAGEAKVAMKNLNNKNISNNIIRVKKAEDKKISQSEIKETR
ncbi:MAG: RNA-binding protein [Thiomargarita sp.]|nr:RNA-binding protein [Thiomargarita sp.]